MFPDAHNRHPNASYDSFRRKREHALRLQNALLQKTLADCPRRNTPLLVINCGAGEVLPAMWHSGFEAVATEPSGDLRKQARSQKHNNTRIYGAHAEELPFEDGTFDWAICQLRDSAQEMIRNDLMEARRVCKRGLIVTFWNSFSLAGLRAGELQALATPHAVVCWFRLWRIIRASGLGRQRAWFTLAGYSWFWKSPTPMQNTIFWRMPIGAWGVVRIDFNSSIPLTSLPVRLSSHFEPKHEPVLEFHPKNSVASGI